MQVTLDNRSLGEDQEAQSSRAKGKRLSRTHSGTLLMKLQILGTSTEMGTKKMHACGSSILTAKNEHSGGSTTAQHEHSTDSDTNVSIPVGIPVFHSPV